MVCQKIREFYLKIKEVNNLATIYLNNTTKVNQRTFETKWKSLCSEASVYFQALSFEDGGWPHKKSILCEKEVDFDVFIYDVEDGIVKSTGRRRKIKNMTISYHIEDNQDDDSPNNQFPYFGIYLASSFSDGNCNIFSVATHKTKVGCNLVSPKINGKELAIVGRENAIKFFDEKDFQQLLTDLDIHGELKVAEEEIFVSNFTVLE